MRVEKVMAQVIYLQKIIQLLHKTTSTSGPLIAKLLILPNASDKFLCEETK